MFDFAFINCLVVPLKTAFVISTLNFPLHYAAFTAHFLSLNSLTNFTMINIYNNVLRCVFSCGFSVVELLCMKLCASVSVSVNVYQYWLCRIFVYWVNSLRKKDYPSH